jgi:nucleotidyltransferase substrate binding protein (TIGR01987 family)
LAVSIDELKKAVDSLIIAINLYRGSAPDSNEGKAFRDASIQRFEYSIELSWKTSMKVIGSSTAAAKLAIREMARNNLIQNPESWIKFIDARNETSHTYDDEVAKKVFVEIEKFLPEVTSLLKNLEKIK